MARPLSVLRTRNASDIMSCVCVLCTCFLSRQEWWYIQVGVAETQGFEFENGKALAQSSQ